MAQQTQMKKAAKKHKGKSKLNEGEDKKAQAAKDRTKARDAMRAGVDRGVGRRRGASYARTSVGGRRIAFSRYPKLERAVEGGTGDGRRRDGGDGRRRDGGDGRRWDARREGARGYRRIRCAVDGFRASERPRGRCRSSDRSNARLNDRPIARGVRRRAWPEVG